MNRYHIGLTCTWCLFHYQMLKKLDESYKRIK